MGNYNDAINKLFNEKENLIILGLTGRTGSGCSTASDILRKGYEKLDLEYIERYSETGDDKYKFEIVKNYISKDDRWIPFTRIEGSCVILSYIFEKENSGKNNCYELINYLKKLQSAENEISFKIDNFGNLIKEISGLEYIFEKVQKQSLSKVEKNGIAIAKTK